MMKPAAALVFGWLLVAPLTVRAAEPAPKPDAKALEFFEMRVRPVLAEHCYSCHGPKKQQAGLRLDSRAAWLKGSDSAQVVTAGAPDKSLVIKALNHQGDVKMPPKNKLKPEAIEALTAWVKMGLPWPDGAVAPSTKDPSSPEAIAHFRQTHWAFRPVQRPEPPAVKNTAWVRTPVDRFVLAKLEEKDLSPAAPAEPRVLLRRLYFDLIGLPPTPEEVDEFVKEYTAKPQAALEQVVERLLASPQYGERWARHWLDVARYADTKGYVFLEERRYPYAYTYRDYVIRAFNEDKPYDQFILEQLAADLLPRGDDPRPLAAMGYLTLGRRFLNNVHDIVDDRIDVTMRGLQGLTVTCARCHDHKFDPIPTKDYYSLYGVFVNATEPKELPLIAMPEQTEAYRAWEAELQAREAKLRDFTNAKYVELLQRLRTRVGDYLLAVRDAERLPGEDHYEALTPGDLHPDIVRRWQAYLAETRKQPHTIFGPWHAFAALPQKEFKDKAAALAKKVAEDKQVNPLVAQLFAQPPETLQDVARRYGVLFADIEKEWQEARAKDDKLAALPDKDREALRQVLYAEKTPTAVSLADVDAKRLFDRAARDQITGLKRKVDEWKANTAVAPPRAMVLNDVAKPTPSRVLVRGNPATPGDPVERQFLVVLAGDQRKPFTQGSGRLELARAIASADNPLTARVMVNRVWLQHFGQGLVRTPSDFGTRGEPPTHPELLDWLAATFVEQGWSIKKLHRAIVLSSAYQQSSAADAKLLNDDPDNRLLARQNRHRLDFEALRDTLLFAAGRLDPKVGGPSVDITKAPFSTRRTVYAFIERQNLPGIFRTFDFASPDTSTAQRFTTTVPQQALFLMNSPFVVEQAKHLAARKEVADAAEPEKRIAALYRLCFGRAPAADEVALGLNFLKEVEADKTVGLSAWEKYAQVLLLANELAFVD